MYGDPVELDFEPEKDDDHCLFDGSDELTVSGNEDPMDSIKHVCLECGGTNGNHHIDCILGF